MYIYGETYPVGYDATRLETYENEPLLQAKLSAMSSRNILTMLGDYWTDYYEDTEALKAIHAGAATLLGDELIENLRHVLASGIIDFPFETAGRVNMFLFDAAKAEYVTGANGKVDYIRYVMPELSDISVLTDRLFEPSVVLEKDAYFKIVSTATGTEVRFYVDIFQDENVLKTVSTIQLDRRIVLLWGSDVLYKERLIHERYGRFLYKPNDDSRDYHFVIMALQKFYISAKSIKNIEVMINILMGIPYSRYDNDKIVAVTEATHNGKSYYRIESEKSVYWAPWLSEVVVEPGDTVQRLDLLARVTTVYDYISKPDWYDKCPFPGKLVVSGTHPDMPEEDEGGGYESAGLRSDSEGTQLEQDLYQLVDQVMKYNLIHIKTTYSTQFSEMTFVPLSEVYTVLVSGLPVYLHPIIQGSIDIEASDQYELLTLTQDELVQDLGIKLSDAYSPTGICKYNSTHTYDGTPLFNYGNIGDYLVVRLDVDPGDGVWEPSFDPSFWTATTGSWSGGGYYEPEQVDGLYHLTLQVIGSWYVDYRPYAMRLRTVGDEMIGMVTVKDSAGDILYHNWELESAAGMLLNFADNDIHNIEIVSSANIDLNFIEFMFKENFPAEPVFSDTIDGGFEDVNGTGFDTIGGEPPDYSALIDAYFYAEIDPAYVDSDLTDFPVAVEVTDSAFFTGMNADSWQYLHATVGGVECSVEVNVWEPENTRAVLWVKVPVVSSTNFTVIEIHANTTPATATGITGDVTAQQVWSNGYIGVYHMADDPAGGVVTDASPSENHGTFNGTVITADRTYNSDAIGYSYNFDGDDSLSVPAVPGANATVDGLFYWTTTAVKQSLFTNGFYYVSNYGVLLVYNPGGDGFKIYTGNQNSSSGVGPGSVDAWHTAFLTTSGGSSHKAYRENAELILTRTDTYSGYRTESYIGNEFDGIQSNFIGKISEARYSNSVRGTAWLRATDAVYRRLLTSGSANVPPTRKVEVVGSYYFDVSSQTMSSVYVKPDFTAFWTTGMFDDRIYKYNMPGTIPGSTYDFSDAITDSRYDEMRGIWFGNNGVKLYVVSGETTNNITSQELSVPYDITSRSGITSQTIPDYPFSLALSDDGGTVFICMKNTAYYGKFYSLSTPWELSTMSEITGQVDLIGRSAIDTTGKNIFTINTDDNAIRLTVLETSWQPVVAPGLQDILIGYLPAPISFYTGISIITISTTLFKAYITDTSYSGTDYVFEYDIEIDPAYVVADPPPVERDILALSFTKVVDDTHFVPLPENLVEVTEPFDADTGQFTLYSNDPGTYSIANGYCEISQPDGQYSNHFAHNTNNVYLPQAFVQADITFTATSKTVYENAFVGIIKDLTHRVYVVANYQTQVVEIQVRNDVANYILGTTAVSFGTSFKLGMGIINNSVSMWIDSGSGWEYIGQEYINSYVNLTEEAELNGYYPAFGLSSGNTGTTTARFDNFKYGRFGGTGIRDITMVTNEDGTAYLPQENTAMFTASISDPSGASSTGVFEINLTNYSYTQVGALAFSDGTYRKNLLPVHIIRNADSTYRITASTFNATGLYGLKVRYKSETVVNPLSGSNVISGMTTLALEETGSDPGVYDSFMFYDDANSRWLLAYSNTEYEGFVPENFYPVLAESTDLVTWNMIGSPMSGNYEGTKIALVKGQYYVVAGGPANSGDSVVIYDTDMDPFGSLNITLEGGVDTQPHPAMFAHGDKYILITFDNTRPSGGDLFSWGNLQVYTSPRYV